LSSAVSPAADVALLKRQTLIAGIVLAFLGSMAFSGKAIIVKLAYPYGVDPITLLALRMLFALPFFLIAAVWVNRKSGQATLRRGDYGYLILLGLSGYYLSSYLDFIGLQYISATLERLILYLSPTFILLFSIFFQKRPAARLQIVALAVSYSGVVVSFLGDFQLGGSNLFLGSALVLGSALLYSAYLIGSGELVKRIGPVRLTAYASTVASIACIVHFLIARPLSALDLPAEVYWLSILNATVCTVFPLFAIMLAVARIGAPLTSQVSLVGPVSTIILSVMILGEQVGPWQIIGTCLVLVGVFLVTRIKSARS